MKNKKAFTLIEVVIALTMLTIMFTAVYGLVISTINVNQRNAHTFQATMLANEGLEAMRFLRDSNWLQNYSFDRGFEAEGIIYLTEESVAPYWRISTQVEEINLDNSVSYNREIIIKKVENIDEIIEVSARVFWNERGLAREIVLSTYLSNFK